MIIAFDTSDRHVTAALLDGDALRVLKTEEMARGQAERLFPLLEEMLAEAGALWRDLTALGVGIGPGNFTGVRISVSAARGLALSLGIPAVGTSTFDALDHDAGDVVTAINAPRGLLYARLPGRAPMHGSLEDLPLSELPDGTGVIGAMAQEIATKTAGPMLQPRYPLAEAIARFAKRHAADATLERPKPLYIKQADAAPSKDAPPVILDDT